MTNEEFQALVLNELKSIRNEMSTKEELREVKQSLARIENNHGTSLTALLDGYHQNAEILDRHTEQLNRIETKVGMHDIQISVLDKTKSNKRRAK
ncbi:MAG: hypothetical protein ABFC84_16485 [Veillonellales bacterium]